MADFTADQERRMCIWYHLSTLDGATAVGLPGTDPATTLHPQVARYQGGELDGQPIEGEHRRISVSPTVWQCLVSISHGTGDRHIYQVSTPAEPAQPVNVDDLAATGERWLTLEWLAGHAEATTVERIGLLPNVEHQWSSIDLRYRHAKSPHFIGKHIGANEDELWTVDENGRWTFVADALPGICGV